MIQGIIKLLVDLTAKPFSSLSSITTAPTFGINGSRELVILFATTISPFSTFLISSSEKTTFIFPVANPGLPLLPVSKSID